MNLTNDQTDDTLTYGTEASVSSKMMTTEYHWLSSKSKITVVSLFSLSKQNKIFFLTIELPLKQWFEAFSSRRNWRRGRRPTNFEDRFQ